MKQLNNNTLLCQLYFLNDSIRNPEGEWVDVVPVTLTAQQLGTF